jgi:hypothetical protein
MRAAKFGFQGLRRCLPTLSLDAGMTRTVTWWSRRTCVLVLHAWNWSDLGTIEVVPVIGSAEAAERAMR